MQDPWNKRNSESPPDLDKLVREFFGGKKGPNTPEVKLPFLSLGTIFFILIALYIMSGFYVVKQPEQAVVTRFGKIHAIYSTGLNWRPRFIDRVYIVNIDEIGSFRKDNMMLTLDENIVSLSVAIQYKRSDPAKFLFVDENPVGTLEQIEESAVRYVIGHSKLDDILTAGKQDITQAVKKIIEQTLNLYDLGLELVDVNLAYARPPLQVQQSFNDVTKAREDEQSYINEAERYRQSQLPIAHGFAQRIKDESRAYKNERINQAQGETERFLLLAQQYKAQPALMRQRLYLETMEKVLSSTTKVLIDPSEGQVFYLPIEKLMEHSGRHTAPSVKEQPTFSRFHTEERDKEEEQNRLASEVSMRTLQLAQPLNLAAKEKSR